MVAIIGGYQSDFARNITREGGEISDLVAECVEHTLRDAGVDPGQIDTIHLGNAFGQLYTGQGHLGAMPATVHDELWGVPAMRHEAACASGSIAVLSAMAELECGRYDCALVLGVEVEKSRPGPEAAQIQQAAAWVGHETEDAHPIWPAMFEQIAQEYERRYGIDEVHLRAIGELNLRNAKDNPLRPDPVLVDHGGQHRGRRPGEPGGRRPSAPQRLLSDHRRSGGRGAGQRSLARGPSRGRAARSHRRVGAPHRRPATRAEARSGP